MARRIIALLLPVLALLIVATIIVAGLLISQRNTQSLHADRVGDATRFAAIVAEAITADDFTRVRAELDAYTDLYSSPVWVLGLDGTCCTIRGRRCPTSPG